MVSALWYLCARSHSSTSVYVLPSEPSTCVVTFDSRLREKKVGDHWSLHSVSEVQICSNGTSGQRLAVDSFRSPGSQSAAAPSQRSATSKTTCEGAAVVFSLPSCSPYSIRLSQPPRS